MLTFDKDAAQKADAGTYITQGGVYVGKLTKAECFSKPSGAAGIEFAFESEDGSKVDFLQVYTKNKNGSENFGLAKIHSLMGLLGITTVQPVKVEDVNTLPILCKRKLGIALRKEEYYKNDGSIGYKFEILHFFDAQTMKTYSEWVDQKEAKTSKREIVDKLVKNNQSNQSGSSQRGNDESPAHDDGDLPF